MLAMQDADIRLERHELGYLATQLVDKADRYLYVDQDMRLSQDLRWALASAKEKDRSNTRRQEHHNFKTTLAEFCEELQYLEFTLKLMA